MIDTKWIKDGEIVTVTNALKLRATEGDADVVWYRDSSQDPHIILRADFLEQYKPYEPIYEYQYAFHTWDVDTNVTNSFFKDDTDFKKINPAYPSFQRLDFTKRERK